MTTDTDTLVAQALALVNEDRRGELADIITAMLEVAVRTTNDMWITRLSQWEPTPAEDAIGYVIHGPAFGSNADQVQQVRDLIRDARARTGAAVPVEEVTP